jgi:hypothetical protein
MDKFEFDAFSKDTYLVAKTLVQKMCLYKTT